MTNAQISKRLSAVKPSATMHMTQLARDLKAKGHDVISLSMGEPDFDTPEFISDAAIKAIRGGKTRYTAVDGISDLKSAICDKFSRENDLNYSADQINVSPGGKAVLYNALLATLNPGDEVIIPAPYWVSYPEMTRLCGASPIVISCDMKSGFKLSPEVLEANISPKSKWLILNSPSNPTGACYSADELRALAAVLLRHPQVLILTDDIYEHLIYDGREFSTIVQVVPELLDRTLTMNGVSKAYAMTGWRLGYAGGPKWLIDAMRKVMMQTTSNPSSITQWASQAALTGPQAFLKERCDVFEQRRNLVVEGLSSAKGLECAVPDGAFYVFPSCKGLLGLTSPAGTVLKTDTDFAQCLLTEVFVAVVPGSSFGAPDHFRLSFAADIDLLELALERIKRFCSDCS